MSSTAVDQVFLKGLKFETVVGPDAWHRSTKSQPIEVDIVLTPTNGLDAAAQDDNVSYTIDYGKLYKQLVASVSKQSFENVHHLSQVIRASLPEARAFGVHVRLPKGVLAADGGVTFGWESHASVSDGIAEVMQTMIIKGIACRCIIGVNPHERVEKQKLEVSIHVQGVENRLSPAILAGVSMDTVSDLSTPAYQAVANSVVERVEGSSYETVEALATAICQLVTINHGFDNARVTIDKPYAIAGVFAAGVTIGRSKAYFENKDFWKIKRT